MRYLWLWLLSLSLLLLFIGSIAIIIMIIIYSSCILTYYDNNSNKIVGHTALRKSELYNL
jgi:predicted transglutaminase-like protease